MGHTAIVALGWTLVGGGGGADVSEERRKGCISKGRKKGGAGVAEGAR